MRTQLASVAALAALACGAASVSRALARPAEPVAADSVAVSSLGLDSLAGRVVLVDFWASWCAPCKKSFPWMNGLLERYAGEGLAIVAVNVDKDRAAADAFLAKHGGRLRIVFDPEGRIAKSYALKAMPSSFLYDRKGALRERFLGFGEKEARKVEASIQALLAEKDST